jgi:DNA repair photolyase
MGHIADTGNEKHSFGHSSVEHKSVKTILSKASGFIGTFDFTLNPYSGCTFGCTYCYAASFASTYTLKNSWGSWVQVKENTLELLRKKRKKSLMGKTIFMSSVTDPYQPVEKELRLTRSVLEELLEYHQPRLVIQTRGPLVTRDIDLLKQFEFLQVNMTITTDDETVRRVFEPMCPSNSRRMEAVSQLSQAGIQTCVTMTPLLPVKDPEQFAQSLLATGAQRFIAQHFHAEAGRFVASTGKAAVALFRERGWTTEAYNRTIGIFKKAIPHLFEGKEGFAPPWVVDDRGNPL